MLNPDDLIPADHPIRRIRTVVDDVLAELDGEFAVTYSTIGRPSIPPQQLSKATVLMAKPRAGDWLADEMAGLREAGVRTLVSALTAAEVRELGQRAWLDLVGR